MKEDVGRGELGHELGVRNGALERTALRTLAEDAELAVDTAGRQQDGGIDDVEQALDGVRRSALMR